MVEESPRNIFFLNQPSKIIGLHELPCCAEDPSMSGMSDKMPSLRARVSFAHLQLKCQEVWSCAQNPDAQLPAKASCRHMVAVGSKCDSAHRPQVA